MTSTLDRVIKLLALANNPNENEGRTAAFLAAKLIRENKLVILTPDDPRLLGRSSYTHSRPAPDPPPRRDPPRPQQPPPRPPPPRDDTMSRPLIIAAKFGGFCKVCLLRYEEGDRIYWMRGSGCSHYACGWDE
jgi:hypothetical protein